MSQKQLMKLVIIIVVAVLVVGGLGLTFFFVDFDKLGGTVDIETIKAEGNYEQAKEDAKSILKLRDTVAVETADILFEDVGIKKYEGMERNGVRGNVTIHADGYALDAFVNTNGFANAYIGNVLVYKNKDIVSATIANIAEFTYEQYNILVEAFRKGLGIDEQKAKDMYSQLTMMGVNSFTDIKSGKLRGIKGYYGHEGNLEYFLKLNESDELDKLYIVYEDIDPIIVYDSLLNNDKNKADANKFKVLSGVRQGLVGGITYQIKQAIGKEVILPPALLNGDDSWTMVNDGTTTYMKTRIEVVDNAEKKEKSMHDIEVHVSSGSSQIIYLKMDRKVYIGG